MKILTSNLIRQKEGRRESEERRERERKEYVCVSKCVYIASNEDLRINEEKKKNIDKYRYISICLCPEVRIRIKTLLH